MIGFGVRRLELNCSWRSDGSGIRLVFGRSEFNLTVHGLEPERSGTGTQWNRNAVEIALRQIAPRQIALRQILRIERILLGLTLHYLTAKICKMREVDMAWAD